MTPLDMGQTGKTQQLVWFFISFLGRTTNGEIVLVTFLFYFLLNLVIPLLDLCW